MRFSRGRPRKYTLRVDLTKPHTTTRHNHASPRDAQSGPTRSHPVFEDVFVLHRKDNDHYDYKSMRGTRRFFRISRAAGDDIRPTGTCRTTKTDRLCLPARIGEEPD